MYVYDIIASVIIGISHLFFYLQLIRYNRLSYTMVITLSIVFTILLGFVVTVTGYPELNIIMYLLFLLSLGLMQVELTFTQNLYFTLASMVSVTLLKMVLMEIGMILFMWSPFNLYLWTASIIHLVVAVVILASILILRKLIQKSAQYIVDSRLYFISFVLLVVGLITVLILTMPSTHFLATLHEQYWKVGYIIAFVLFFVLLLIVLISTHLTKERLLGEQQNRLDRELLDYVEKLEILHDELASFRHDYTNVLATLDEGVRTKNIVQIEQIYHEVIAPTSKLINNQELDIVKLSNINIPEVKSLLSVKLIAAQRQNVQVMIDIPKQIDEINIPIVDFIRVISILIDNGIEEALHSRDKTLQFAFFEMENKQYFIVRNSSNQKMIDLEKIYQRCYSSKKGNQGYGLFSLKRIINQTTNVSLETSLQGTFFTQTLIIKN